MKGKSTEDYIKDLLWASAKQLGIKTKPSKQQPEVLNTGVAKKYIHSSDWHGVNSNIATDEKDILNKLRYLGLQRVNMPDIPDKSPHLWKAQSAEYVNFMKDGT